MTSRRKASLIILATKNRDHTSPFKRKVRRKYIIYNTFQTLWQEGNDSHSETTCNVSDAAYSQSPAAEGRSRARNLFRSNVGKIVPLSVAYHSSCRSIYVFKCMLCGCARELCKFILQIYLDSFLTSTTISMSISCC